MVKFDVGNLLKLPQLLKIPELLMGFIILIIARAGYDGYPVLSVTIDGGYLNAIVSFGFFFIVLIQLIGILLGDKTPISDALFSFFGFLFFISSGSLLIRDSDVLGIKFEYTPSMRALGSLQIINSLLYLVDFVFSAMNIAKKE